MSRKPDEHDHQILRCVSGAGMYLRPAELADALGLEQADVDRRLKRLERRGYIKSYVIATPQGSAAART